MKLVKKEKFGTLTMDFYKNEDNEVFATRKQIGEALGYADAQNGIDKIHLKYRERFEGKSVTAKLEGTDGKRYDTMLYNSKGIMEICRRAKTNKADEFFDWVSEVIDELRKEGVVVSDVATYEQVIYNVDLFMVNLNNYDITKLYDLVAEFLQYHRANKTRLPYKNKSKARHGNKKYKSHIESMEMVRDELVEWLNVRIDSYGHQQIGLATELIRVREMVRVSVENMRYRTAATSK